MSTQAPLPLRDSRGSPAASWRSPSWSGRCPPGLPTSHPDSSAQVPSCRCPGCSLGVLVYPLLLGLGWFVRRAERNERDFADLVREADR